MHATQCIETNAPAPTTGNTLHVNVNAPLPAVLCQYCSVHDANSMGSSSGIQALGFKSTPKHGHQGGQRTLRSSTRRSSRSRRSSPSTFARKVVRTLLIMRKNCEGSGLSSAHGAAKRTLGCYSPDKEYSQPQKSHQMQGTSTESPTNAPPVLTKCIGGGTLSGGTFQQPLWTKRGAPLI